MEKSGIARIARGNASDRYCIRGADFLCDGTCTLLDPKEVIRLSHNVIHDELQLQRNHDYHCQPRLSSGLAQATQARNRIGTVQNAAAYMSALSHSTIIFASCDAYCTVNAVHTQQMQIRIHA